MPLDPQHPSQHLLFADNCLPFPPRLKCPCRCDSACLFCLQLFPQDLGIGEDSPTGRGLAQALSAMDWQAGDHPLLCRDQHDMEGRNRPWIQASWLYPRNRPWIQDPGSAVSKGGSLPLSYVSPYVNSRSSGLCSCVG